MSKEQKKKFIFRKVDEKGRRKETFTSIATSLINDPDLSVEDVGTMVKLLSNEDHWNQRMEGFEKELKVSSEKRLKIINKLELLYYVVRKKFKNHLTGQMEWELYVYEDPKNNPRHDDYRNPDDGNPLHGNPGDGRPQPGSPVDGNMGYIINNSYNQDKVIKKKEINSSSTRSNLNYENSQLPLDDSTGTDYFSRYDSEQKEESYSLTPEEEHWVEYQLQEEERLDKMRQIEAEYDAWLKENNIHPETGQPIKKDQD